MLLKCGVEEDSWESLGQQGDQTVNPKGNHPWLFTRRTDAEAGAPVLWPPDAKSWLLVKDPDAGGDSIFLPSITQEEKGVTEDEMVGWHHWLNGHELEKTLGDSWGQGSLACCSPWGCKESDTTERLMYQALVHQWTGGKVPTLDWRQIIALEMVTSVLFFKIFFFFSVDHLKKSLYWVCCNIASVLCFGFLAMRHVGPWLLD